MLSFMPSNVESFISDIAGVIQSMSILILILGIVFTLLPYFVHGYAIMCTGRKAKVDGDFMPFIPVARQIYQMKIAKCPVWYIFFFGTTTVTVVTVGLISSLLYKLTGKMAIVTVLCIIYIIANMVFTFLYYQKYYDSLWQICGDTGTGCPWIQIHADQQRSHCRYCRFLSGCKI